MATDARTTNRNYPKPHPDNLISEDFPRLTQALDAIDTDVAGLLTSVAGRALLAHEHVFAEVPGLQAALDGKSATTHTHTFDNLSDVNVAGAANGQTIQRVAGVWQPWTISGLDASVIASGVLDPARIPVVSGQTPVVSSGGLGALTTPQQAAIGVGTIVMTTDGLRWVFSVLGGDKTDPASYIQLADITPEWTAVANKPSDITNITALLAGKLSHTGGTMTGSVGFGDGLSVAWGNAYIYGVHNTAMLFHVGGVEHGRVNVSGNWGFGSSSPAAKLDVNGTFIARDDARVIKSSYPKRILEATGNASGKRKWQEYISDTGKYRIAQLNDAESAEVSTDPISLSNPIEVSGSVGTVGQVMTSGGAGAAPSWSTMMPPGVILPYAVSGDPPTGWLMCAGQAVSRSTYSGLFSAIGTAFGPGDGSTTFNIPDLRGRAAFGKDNMGEAAGGTGGAANRVTFAGSGITGTTMGAAGGAETHTLTTAQMPSHTHQIASVSGPNQPTVGAENATGVASSGEGLTMNSGAWNTGSQGSGNAHNNMPPAMMLNMIIKT